jgi:hypothetical protein
MPFFLDGNPTQSEISEAINYLLGNSQQTTSTNIVNGQVTDALGDIVSYLYKYISVKYADSFDGTVNFSNTPTSRLYYGLRNDDSATESTNPADYIWYQVSGGFSTNKFIFYSVTGGRRINIVVGLSAPSILYQADTGAAIDLDQISGSDGSSSRICYAKSTSFALASTPATYQTSGPSGFPPTNTWGGAETWQATPPTLAVNEALFQSDGIYNPVTDLTTWNVPYLSNLRVGALSAISANLGTITAGELIIGSSPAISGNSMTGSGAHIYTDGTFAYGNSTKNFVFNSSGVFLNGFTSGTTATTALTFINTSTTILSFTITKQNPIILNLSGTFGITATTASIGSSVLATLTYQVVNSSGTVVSNGTVCQPIAGIYLQGSSTDYSAAFPSSMARIFTLPIGNYTLKVFGQSAFFNSAGTSITPATVNHYWSGYQNVYEATI